MANAAGVSCVASATTWVTGPGADLVVDLVGEVGVQRPQDRGVRWLVEVGARGARAVDRGVAEADRAADEVEVVAGQHDPPDREAERVDRIAERTELRRHGERVDHGGAVAVEDDAGVRHAEAGGLLEPGEHPWASGVSSGIDATLPTVWF